MTPDLPCQELVELVTAYIEDELDPDARRRFDDHLASCEGCRTYLGQMRRTVAMTGELREESVGPVMLQRLAAAFRDWRDQPPSPR